MKTYLYEKLDVKYFIIRHIHLQLPKLREKNITGDLVKDNHWVNIISRFGP